MLACRGHNKEPYRQVLFSHSLQINRKVDHFRVISVRKEIRERGDNDLGQGHIQRLWEDTSGKVTLRWCPDEKKPT